VGDFGGEQIDVLDERVSVGVGADSVPVDELFDDHEHEHGQEPLPELGRMEEEDNEVGVVEEVGEVEDLEVALAADEGHGEEDHDAQDDHEDPAGGSGAGAYPADA